MINRKTRNENGKKESFFQWMIFCGLLLIFVYFLCVPYFAETENNIDKNKTIYVYFGEYPQTELDDTEINDEVINTYYDENDEGSIDGVKYLRKKSQDEQYHYYKYEPVRWRVMKKEDRNLYLISDKVIESGEYFAKETWENSELRKKLNNDFVNKLLSEQELSACISVNEDYVWILDESEWYNSEYGFSEFCKISENNTRHFYVSDYVKSNEYIWNIKNQTSILLKEENESFGYLRPDGMTYTFDNSQDTGAYGVCPVICVDESAVEYMDVSEEIKDPNINNGNVKKVYIGYYPQSEILGDALNEAIINSKYDMNGDTVVNRIKYFSWHSGFLFLL